MELQRHLGGLRAQGSEVLGVSMEPTPSASRGARKLHLTFPLLHDTDHHLGMAFHDFELNPVQPTDADAIFVLNAEGQVTWHQLTNEHLIPGSAVIAALRRA